MKTFNPKLIWQEKKKNHKRQVSSSAFLLRDVLIWWSGMSMISGWLKLGHCVCSPHSVLLTVLCHWYVDGNHHSADLHWHSSLLFLQLKMTRLLSVMNCFIAHFHIICKLMGLRIWSVNDQWSASAALTAVCFYNYFFMLGWRLKIFYFYFILFFIFYLNLFFM